MQLFRLTPLIAVPDWRDRLVRIFPVSVLSMANIVLGNVALRYIPVSFMQTVKSFTPAVGGAFLPFLVILTLFFRFRSGITKMLSSEKQIKTTEERWCFNTYSTLPYADSQILHARSGRCASFFLSYLQTFFLSWLPLDVSFLLRYL